MVFKNNANIKPAIEGKTLIYSTSVLLFKFRCRMKSLFLPQTFSPLGADSSKGRLRRNISRV
jgi:hypothetical protein